MCSPWIEYRINELCATKVPVYNKKEWAQSKLIGGVQDVSSPINQDQNIKCILITDWIIEISGAAGLGETVINDKSTNLALFRFIQSVANQNIIMNECFHLVESEFLRFVATNDKVIHITVGFHRISTKT